MNTTRKVGVGLAVLLEILLLGYPSHLAGTMQENNVLDRQVRMARSEEKTTRDAFMTILASSSTPGGIVLLSGCEPSTKYKFAPLNTSLRDALNALVSADSLSRWDLKDGVVNVVPVHRIPALLKVRIAEFDTRNAATISDALHQLLALPEVEARIAKLHLNELQAEPGLTDLKKPGSANKGQEERLDVHGRNVTLRGALNALVHAHGYAVWSYTERRCNGKNDFRIEFLVR
jgi:hypothetical protein